MENVDAFNNELSGLYSAKPPISKAKMAAITRAAMKAIKFYKHVVQSVEKFILKCKPEYKIPGLYVIDSIVRQSRHQFGPEKDVFAPRFARNVKSTFANLFRGVPEDKSRIIRVLNLWQKNNVFAPEVINPLFDLADPNHPIYQLPPGTQDNSGSDANGMNLTMSDNNMSMSEENHGIPDLSIGHQTANAKILDQSTLRQLQHIQQILIRQTTAAAQNEIANSGSNTGVSGGIIGSSSSSGGGGGGSNAANINQSDSVKFNKKVLEYDYDEEEEHEDKSTSPHVPNLIDGNNLTQLLKDPNVLRQLQTLQQYKKQQEEKQIKLNEMRIQEEAFEKHLQNVLKGTNCPPVMPGISSNQTGQDNMDKEVEFVSEDGKIEVINLDGNDSRSPTPERYNKRRRSRSRSRGRGGGNNNNDRDRRRRSRSRSSRSRSPKPNRRRGSSRDRGGNTGSKDKDREKERDREYERERKRKGLPETKKDHLSVCSTTLWVGHLSKLVQPEELSDSFGKYGDIVSIDMIHPRGCAFIVMNRRQDAYKAMGLLKNFKMQGRAITISWAAGKGVKSKEWKDFWDLELGVSYIPCSKLNEDTDLEALEEGGMFDEDSMPSWMKEKINKKKSNRDKLTGQPSSSMFPSNTGIDTIRSLDITQPPPSAVGPLMPPPGLVPQFSMGPPVPRMMGGPMGPPGMPGMPPPGMPGMPPMPPNMMPPGMPPPGMMPHGMLPPPHGGMMAGFPTIPPPQIDKNMVTSQSGPGNGPLQNDGTGGVPPSMTGGPPPQFMGGFNMQSMLSMPPQFQQPPPQPSVSSSDSAANQNSQNNSSNEDQMDIEMEDDMPNISSGKSSSFNQPPPLFPNFPSDILSRGENRRNDRGERDGNENRIEIDFGGNNRNRGETHGSSGDFRNNNNNRSANSRWGGNDRGSRDRHNRDGNIERDMGPPPGWNENGMGNFPGSNFNDNGVGRPGMNMPPFEIPNQQGNQFFEMRHDDFNDDRRGSNNGPPRDFFPDRYGGGGSHSNSGGSGPQMRGGQPQFGPRLGNIFMRGHVSRNGPHGGGGFNHNNFNDRPPFDREDRGGGGGGAGRNMQDRRGGMQDRRGGGGRGNWRDEEDLMERGGGFRRGGRFQNRDDRVGRDRDRSGGGRDRNQRDRNSRDRSSSSGGRNNRRNSSSNRDDEDRQQQQQHNQPENVNNEEEPNQQQPQDTEDDWDQELEEFNINAEIPANSETATLSSNNRRDENVIDDQHNNDKTFNNEISHSNNDENLFERRSDENTIFAQPATTEQHQSQHNNNKREDSGGNFNNTPLYDEPNEGGGGGNNGNSQNQQQVTDHKLSPKNKNSTNLNDSSNVETNFETSSSTTVIGDDDTVNE